MIIPVSVMTQSLNDPAGHQRSRGHKGYKSEMAKVT
jgi:hypothetical protein